MQRRVAIAVLGAFVLGGAVVACDVVDAPPNPDEPVPVVESTTTTSAPAPATTSDCEGTPPSDPAVRLSGDVVEQSIQLAQMWSGCLSTVVLARPAALDGASGVAAARSAPLIAWDPLRSDVIVALLEELGISEVLTTSSTVEPQGDIPVRRVEPVEPIAASGGPVWLLSDSTTDPSLLQHLATLNGANAIVDVPFADLSEEQRRLIAGADELIWSPAPTPTEQWQLASIVDDVVTINGTRTCSTTLASLRSTGTRRPVRSACWASRGRRPRWNEWRRSSPPTPPTGR